MSDFEKSREDEIMKCALGSLASSIERQKS
jgi:hypothetical protein